MNLSIIVELNQSYHRHVERSETSRPLGWGNVCGVVILTPRSFDCVQHDVPMIYSLIWTVPKAIALYYAERQHLGTVFSGTTNVELWAQSADRQSGVRQSAGIVVQYR